MGSRERRREVETPGFIGADGCRECALNLRAVLRASLGSLDGVERIVKVLGSWPRRQSSQPIISRDTARDIEISD
jgi:hypothetical protein